MKMSAAYMRETAEHLGNNGYSLTHENEDKLRDGQLIFVRERYTLKRGEAEHFELETIIYPSGVETYFIEIKRYHAMTCFSFPLDSWKHRPDRVEFKYYTHPDTGLGLSFILALPKS